MTYGPVYSYPFIYGSVETAGIPFYVPAGFTVVIRDVEVWYQYSTSEQEFWMTDGAGAIFAQSSLPADSEGQATPWHGRVVVLAGFTFRANSGYTTVLAHVAGYLLQGEPPAIT